MGNQLRIIALASVIAIASPGRSVDAETPAALEDTYFPKNAFSDLTYDSFLVDVFRKHLRQLAEPSLNAGLDDVFAIRCLWMSPYKGDELIRIESRHGQKPFVVYKRAEVDQGGNASNHHVRKMRISGQIVEVLTGRAENNGLMDLSNRQDVISTDGPIWLMELYNKGRYHAVYRTDPKVGAFRQTCESLAKVANVPLDIE